jgi:hypothetical protein
MTSYNKRPRKEKDMMNIKFNYEEKNVVVNSFELGRKICGVQQLQTKKKKVVNNNFELRREKHDLIMKDKEVEEQGELQV